MTADRNNDLSAAGTGAREPSRGFRPSRLVFLLPILVFLAIAGWFAWGLLSDRDPREVPSALIDKPVPDFALGPVPGLDVPGLSRADIVQHDGPVLLNVFASWCVPCRVEHPVLMRLAEREGVPIYAISYKDKPEDARRWLANRGNPYRRVGADLDGRAGIQLGVYGVPETYVIGPSGTIRYKQIGPIDARSLRETILPLLAKLRE